MLKIDLTYRDKLQPFFDRLQTNRNLLNNSRPMPEIALRKKREAISIEWIYNSNSIEGNTLSLRETQMVLQDGITIKGKSLREDFESKNHEKALDYLSKLSKPSYKINSGDILSIHALILNSIEDDYAGRLRNSGVRISGANFVPPNAQKVSGLLDELIVFVLKKPLKLNDLELATVFHHQFVWIHPFFDGNGRIIRLAMNLLFLKVGYTPAIILKNDRKKYYTALNIANKGDYEKLMLLMAQAVERTLNIHLNALPDSDFNYKEISNLVEEVNLPYGMEYISLLARQGKIDAYKEGRNWLTSEEAVNNYIKTRKRIRKL